MTLRRNIPVGVLLLAALGFGGCESQVVRSKGYGGFQVDAGSARPAPTAFSPTPEQTAIKTTKKKFDPFAPVGSFFKGIGDAFTPDKDGEESKEQPAPSPVPEEELDSAYRPAWRKGEPQVMPAPREPAAENP